MPIEYTWAPPEDGRLYGGLRFDRIDGPDKAAGRAQYAYDRNLPGMLIAKLVSSPYAHARITKIDTSEAEKIAGVRGIEIIRRPGSEIQWAGAEIAAVAAETGEIAQDGADAVKIEYEVLSHLVKEENLTKAGKRVNPGIDKTEGNPDQAFQTADVVHEGYYGCSTIAHCCLEPHGQVVDWQGDEVIVYASTQGISAIGAELSKMLSADKTLGKSVSPSQVRVVTPAMGGGFGSKFSLDSWGVACARLAKRTGRPVKLMLNRDQEMMVAGARPSLYGKVKVAAKKDGTLTAYQSESWSTGGITGHALPPLPYLIEPPNRKMRHSVVSTNTGPARAFRAPNHPQAAMLTMCAYDDLAAKLKMNPLEFFSKNVGLTPRPDVYRTQLDKAAELMAWKAKWRLAGEDPTPGPVKRGLGVSMHTWGGGPNKSEVRVTIHPDGSVVAECGTQDVGTGTRTALGIVVASSLGLPVSGVQVKIGDTLYPPSGASGGSSTVGGVSAAARRAAKFALVKLKEAVAPALGVTGDANPQIESRFARLAVKVDFSRQMSWRQACNKLGARSISVVGRQPQPEGGKLADSGVGGVQMADVSVDTETGVVTLNKMVAVQDCGLVINLKAAESQVYGALVMGISQALWEERIYDEASGKLLNADMEFYQLSGIGDIGELVVHVMTGVYDERGVIGLGEPPVISPGPAISNAVFNAIGIRVPTLPLTPDKVLDALAAKKRGSA